MFPKKYSNLILIFIISFTIEIHSNNSGKGGKDRTCGWRHLLFRSITGTCNNLENRNYGSSNHVQVRSVVPKYMIRSDDALYDVNRSGPRDISNQICQQIRNLGENVKNGSLLLIYFGQFVDHDIAKTEADARYEKNITVPSNDEFFKNDINFHRSRFMKDGHKYRQFRNSNTGYLDLSNIYGDTKKHHKKLRAFKDGLMKTIQIFKNGHPGDEYLPLKDSKNVGDLSEHDQVMFECGDERCNENPILLSITTIFVREHNRLARLFIKRFPRRKDSVIFEYARRRNILNYQKIIYEEWLPLIVGKDVMKKHMLKKYRYKKTGYPNTDIFFTTVSFRFGHSGIGNFQFEMDSSNNNIIKKHELRDVFFKSKLVLNNVKSINHFMYGSIFIKHEKIDLQIVDGLRNFLFQPNQQLDLMALNIQRGRDHGLNTFNKHRESLKLKPYKNCDKTNCFLKLTNDRSLARKLKKLYYNDFDAIDPFVAGLAEKRFKDSQLGETFSISIVKQFEKFRLYDRFFYERYRFKSLSFRKILELNLHENISGLKSGETVFQN